MDGTWGEYVSFRRMVTPALIQVIFWIVVAFVVLGGLVTIASGAPVQGLLLIVLGPLFVRVYAELLIVIFRINDNVAAIRAHQTGPAPYEPPPAA